MKYIKSENMTPLSEMEMVKIRLTEEDDIPESIWAKKDKENKKYYLQNDSIALFPYHSWGLEIPFDNTDITQIKGNSPDKAVLTLHYEAYDFMMENKLIDKNGIAQIVETINEEKNEIKS